MPLPEPCPDLTSLDLLVSVGQLGSISAAASAHGISQPAASLRLRSLERLLGIQLLERMPSGARLSDEGVATAEWASQVLADVRTLLAGTAAMREDRDSQLCVAASLTVAEYLVPRWLGRIAALEPSLRVSLQMGNSVDVSQLVAAGEVHLGFIEGSKPPGRLRSRELLEDELLIVVSNRHPWARRRRPLSPTELAAARLILREEGSGTREVLTRALASHGLAPTAAMELGSTTAIKAAVAGGRGPAVVSALALRAELQGGQLVAVPHEGLELRRAIRAIWHSGRALPPAARRLLAIASSPEE